MKKTVTILLAALVAFTLAGCGSSKDQEADVAADVEEMETDWVDTVYEAEATENSSEKIEDIEAQITELAEAAEDLETDSAFAMEDIIKMESNAEEEIMVLESDIEELESEKD